MTRRGVVALQPEVRAYHHSLVERLGAVLGERLIGVYASGSFGLDDFDPVRSDLDRSPASRWLTRRNARSSEH